VFLAEHELTQSHYVVLVTIKTQGSVGQRRLAELVAMDARNIGPVLDSLAARGFVERQTDDIDRRRRTITLTDSGRALLEVIATAAATEQDQFLRALTPSDRQDLNRLLRQIYNSHLQTA
jgi:DNA-binding MarR family transcriptional regulator